MIAAVLAAALVPAVAEAGECVPSPTDEAAPMVARTDHDITGNRVAGGCGPLDGDILDVELSNTPAWVLPDPSDHGSSWFVVLEDGTLDHVVADGADALIVNRSETPPLPAGHPPLALASRDGEVAVRSALEASGRFDDPLPDTRVTELADGALAALAGSTDRYDHGVLGDGIEASGIEVRDQAGPVARVAVGTDEVVEGTSAMVVELVTNDLGPELLVTVSDADDGARLRVYDLDGSVVAESEPIGQGYRWMHQVGVGILAPDGEPEVIAVRTPHIGGIVDAYRLIDDRLELVATASGYSSHQLGSGNLDMALLADADGDGRLDVVVPTQAMDEIALLVRTTDGFEESDRLALDGRLLTNLAATQTGDGSLVLAAGTDDGRLRIFR